MGVVNNCFALLLVFYASNRPSFYIWGSPLSLSKNGNRRVFWLSIMMLLKKVYFFFKKCTFHRYDIHIVLLFIRIVRYIKVFFKSLARPMLCTTEKSTSKKVFFILQRRFTPDGSMVGKNKIHIQVRYAKKSRNMYFGQFWETFIFAVIFVRP